MTNHNNIDVLSAQPIGEHVPAYASAGQPARPSRTHGAPTNTRFPFTPKALDALKCTGGRYEVRDALCPGLELRVTPDKKSYSFAWGIKGTHSKARIALGTYPATPIQEARERAVAARGHVEAGSDPRLIAAKPPEKTIAEMIEDYHNYKLAPKGKAPLRTAGEIMRRLRREVAPFVGSVAVKDFDVSHMTQVMDQMEDRECFVLANRVFSDMKRVLKLAVRRGIIKYSPLAELEPPHDEASGTRFLSIEEIQHFWHHSPKALIRSPKVQLILRVILATSKRSNEVCGARRSEIDWGNRVWTIPKARIKGQEKDVTDEIVPLSDLAFALLQEAARRSNSEFLFPDDDADGPYQPGVVSKAVRLAVEPADGLPLGRLGMVKWTPHDLRRTVGTQMLNTKNGLGITKAQKYLALNHKTPDADDKEERNAVSDKHYDMNKYSDEKREALDKWGAFLAKLVGAEQMREAA